VQTVRVTCPECDFSFSIADSRVGGLIACRDCKAEFRVEFAEDDEPASSAAPIKPSTDRDDRPASKPARTRSRVDVDSEPEAWKTDLPIRSPAPLLLTLVGLQVLVAGFLVLNWFMPAGAQTSQPTYSYFNNYPTTTKTTFRK